MTVDQLTQISYPSTEFELYAASSGRSDGPVGRAVVDEIRSLYDQVAKEGIAAVEALSRDLDGLADGVSVVVEPALLAAQAAKVGDRLALSLRTAYDAQYRVAEASLAPDVAVDVRDGVVTRIQHRPIPSAALYIPGGRERYPSTLVSLLANARAAGVSEVTVLLPPDADGMPDPACAWVAAMAGGQIRILCGNGPALIAALALGVDGLPSPDLVVGPGGPAVVAAQMIAAEHGLATGPAFGRTECAVLAGPQADPRLLVADLLTESEHGHAPRLVLIAWGGIETAFREALAQDLVLRVGNCDTFGELGS